MKILLHVPFLLSLVVSYIFSGCLYVFVKKVQYDFEFSLKSDREVKLVTVVESDPKAPFSKATTPRCREGRYSFPRIAPLYRYLVMLSVKESGIKYHFLSLWYDSICD